MEFPNPVLRFTVTTTTEEAEEEMADNDMESPEDRNEARDLTMAAGFGAAIGIIVGTVVFAITQNPVWIGIGIPFGAAFGVRLWAVPQTTRR